MAARVGYVCTFTFTRERAKMQMWQRDDPSNASRIAIADPDARGTYPDVVPFVNDTVAEITCVAPGIYWVEARECHSEVTMVLTGAIHGDEQAGRVILDRLIRSIRAGTLPVRRNLLLMFGNLKAMAADHGVGVRCIEPEAGVTSNLNRCFNRGRFEKPRCYAERRANEMMDAVQQFVRPGTVEALDIHQSFVVPQLCDVRAPDFADDRSEYTYAMLYPVRGVEDTLGWIYSHYSDIVAGAVLNDMETTTHHTFAGFMATAYDAHAATFEQGTIGYVDHDSFTPQLYDNLARSIAGGEQLEEPLGFDVWRCVRSICGNGAPFTFLDKNGEPRPEPIVDFMPIDYTVVARCGDEVYEIEHGQRLLFAKADVPAGDRAAQVIERVTNSSVPPP